MQRSDLRIGITADLFDTKGRPLFGEGPLGLLEEAGLRWTIVDSDGARISPEALASHDALFIGGARVNDENLAQDAGRLRVLARNGVGFDALDLPAISRRGILVTNTPVAVRHSVATSALAFILALSLRLPLKARLPREGRWRQRGDFPGVGLPGRSVGIVGLGGIGQELVRLLQPFNLQTRAADPLVDEAVFKRLGVERTDLETLLAVSDFIVIACLLDDTTRGLIDARRLSLVKPTAFLINIARGPIIDETALIEALRKGALAGAGLDVLEKEPPDPANPLLTMENVIVTPHSLCWTDTFMDAVARTAIKSIVDVALGRLPEFVVNREAIDSPRVRTWRG